MQTASPGQYKSAFDCFLKTINRESVGGLYKGVASPILGIGFCNAVLFTANGFFRSALAKANRSAELSIGTFRRNSPILTNIIGQMMLAGSMAGSIMALANCPIELLKVRLQIQDPSAPQLYTNIIHCARHALATQGIRGIYRGFTATILRDIPSFAGYFGTYEGLKALLGPTSEGSHATWKLLVAGGLAGIGAWLPCYPQDVIKSRMQASANYANTWQCAKQIYRQAGLRGFFRGFGPTLARAFPANAATFVAYEFVYTSLS